MSLKGACERIGHQRTADQLKEIVDGDYMLEIFQDGDVRLEIHWQRVVAPYKPVDARTGTGSPVPGCIPVPKTSGLYEA